MESASRKIERKVDQLGQKLDELAEQLTSNPSMQSRLEVYECALKEVVNVLEQTKSSFKSKQLKELREKIQNVLAQK